MPQRLIRGADTLLPLPILTVQDRVIEVCQQPERWGNPVFLL
ncbi:Uncharacterised protein [Yersinia pseudotuberculosis]|nr:Uncharacterised protein [Yersinia pseudotuberculosis]